MAVLALYILRKKGPWGAGGGTDRAILRLCLPHCHFWERQIPHPELPDPGAEPRDTLLSTLVQLPRHVIGDLDGPSSCGLESGQDGRPGTLSVSPLWVDMLMTSVCLLGAPLGHWQVLAE